MKRAWIVALWVSCCLVLGAKADPRLRNSSREERNGWIYLHLQGTPAQIGFQHGYLLAPEIDDALRMLAHYFAKGPTQKEWPFFRDVAERVFWPKLEKEYQEEIAGIAAGLKARGFSYDAIDVTALNAHIEIDWYYIPWLAAREKGSIIQNKVSEKCSAFIATGSWTQDGKIVVAHNNWSGYVSGERWNVIADIVPAQGQRLLMDCFPGFIHSGDDFVINGAGIVYTETTITQFSGFDEDGTPEFMRARKAAQYAASIDDFVRIMLDRNNGAYANDWLVGDIKTGEIARLELGLKNHRIWRTKDGWYEGANYPSDPKLTAEETTFDASDMSTTPNSRKCRWAQLALEIRGKIDAELAKALMADHYDPIRQKTALNNSVLCGHSDLDPRGAPEWEEPPFNPGGAVQAKVTTGAMAAEMKIWARMGHPCGKDFLAAPFLALHPEFKWQEPFLKDMKGNPWTLFAAKR